MNKNTLVLGVGNGASNAFIRTRKFKNCDYIFISTERITQHHVAKKGIRTIGLGSGFGTGGDVTIGRKLAEGKKEKFAEIVRNYDYVFILTTLGGGSGGSVTETVLSITDDLNIETTVIGTTPFLFEGRLRNKRANSFLEKFSHYTDRIITLSYADYKEHSNEAGVPFKLIDHYSHMDRLLSMLLEMVSKKRRSTKELESLNTKLLDVLEERLKQQMRLRNLFQMQ